MGSERTGQNYQTWAAMEQMVVSETWTATNLAIPVFFCHVRLVIQRDGGKVT